MEQNHKPTPQGKLTAYWSTAEQLNTGLSIASHTVGISADLLRELNRAREIDRNFQIEVNKFFEEMRVLDLTLQDEVKKIDKKIDRTYDLIEKTMDAGHLDLAEKLHTEVMENTSMIDKLIKYHENVTLSGIKLRISDGKGKEIS
jgi:hypothetical protein